MAPEKRHSHRSFSIATAARQRLRIVSASSIAKSSSWLRPMLTPNMIILARACSNVSGSAHSGWAAIKDCINRQMRWAFDGGRVIGFKTTQEPTWNYPSASGEQKANLARSQGLIRPAITVVSPSTGHTVTLFPLPLAWSRVRSTLVGRTGRAGHDLVQQPNCRQRKA
jgi:hypothetical protein